MAGPRFNETLHGESAGNTDTLMQAIAEMEGVEPWRQALFVVHEGMEQRKLKSRESIKASCAVLVCVQPSGQTRSV